ncbi:MAG: OmpA/MotB domain protein [Bryobacterales bacterium]|nr:OmpA/MotB domain protein [Bryobacterales bacterium]
MKLRTAGVALFIALASFACTKKKVVATAPSAPAPAVARDQPTPAPAPKVNNFGVYPASISPGGAATLRWSVSNASKVTISAGVGSVEPASGSQRVSPTQTTVYNLTASGPGGSADGSATLTVVVTAATAAPAAHPKTLGELVQSEVRDVHFAYDASNISEEAGSTLVGDATALKQILQSFPDAKLMVEGHCDERGSAEYNLALGDRRARAARDYLTRMGVAESHLDMVSYGKEKPQCTESTESCWASNRRAHFAAK